MATTDRRSLLRAGLAFFAIPNTTILNMGQISDEDNEIQKFEGFLGDQSDVTNNDFNKKQNMKIHYLEIVTTDVAAACALYAAMYGVAFGGADPSLGGARTAKLDDGGMLGVRAPLRDTEQPIVRPYVLVGDIKASVAAARSDNAEIAMEPMEIPGYGQFAIVIQGGIELGLWQL